MILGKFVIATAILVQVEAACFDAPSPKVNWQRCYHDGAILKGRDLEQANLRDGSFVRADISSANLSGVNAYRSKFISARLEGARLNNANLTEADLTKAILDKASLEGADLRRAKLFHASLKVPILLGPK